MCQICTTPSPTSRARRNVSSIWPHSISTIIGQRYDAVGQGSRDQADQEAGHQGGDLDHAQHEFGLGLVEDKPAHGRGLEPGADQADRPAPCNSVENRDVPARRRSGHGRCRKVREDGLDSAISVLLGDQSTIDRSEAGASGNGR